MYASHVNKNLSIYLYKRCSFNKSWLVLGISKIPVQNSQPFGWEMSSFLIEEKLGKNGLSVYKKLPHDNNKSNNSFKVLIKVGGFNPGTSTCMRALTSPSGH